MRKIISILFASVLCVSMWAITLPECFTDNLVLQQQTEARLWGTAKPNEKVAVSASFMKKTIKTTADSTGYFAVGLPTPAAGFEPQTITIKAGKESVTLHNVLIGEVWFCSGQSNMEMPLKGFWGQAVDGAAQAIAYSGDYPQIRMLYIPKRLKEGIDLWPDPARQTSWKVASPATAADFSALGYFYAQTLTRVLRVPVGIICCSYGGSKVESWLPREIVTTYPDYPANLNQYNDSLLAAGNDWYVASLMYEAMLRPLVGYSIRGFLWNQGESNVGRHDTYPTRLQTMVSHWRDLWGDDANRLPFYFVELPPYFYDNPEDIWGAVFRSCQHDAAAIIPNSGIITTNDLIKPEELKVIHGSLKQPLGERLALYALNKTYGQSSLKVDAPEYDYMEIHNDTVVLHFTNAADRLTPELNIVGFEVAGADSVFYPATAWADDIAGTILLHSDSVSEPVAAAYCFRNFLLGNLHDAYGNPVVPFRTE